MKLELDSATSASPRSKRRSAGSKETVALNTLLAEQQNGAINYAGGETVPAERSEVLRTGNSIVWCG
jgi:hypothetical protein